MKSEGDFKLGLKKDLQLLFPGCIITKLDAMDLPGIPDMLILYNDKWASLEVKRSEEDAKRVDSHTARQNYYVSKMNEMSFSAYIYPENKEEVLYDLQRSFEP